MNFDAFETASREAFDEIPAPYREGVAGIVVRRAASPHPRLPAVYTLGECVTEAYPSDWSGPDTVRSVVVLHWGSFRALAGADPAFDWREQIWETLVHELRHHLESLADRDDLHGVDYAMEQTFLRDQGEDFAPDYYRHGDRIGPGAYAVEDEVYIEQRWRPADLVATEAVRFSWGGRTYAVPAPADLGDVHFLSITGGVSSPPFLELVLVRRPASWCERIWRALARSGPRRVVESEAAAAPLDA